MKSFLKSLAAIFLLSASSNFAHANTLNGSIGIAAPVVNAFTPNGLTGNSYPTGQITFSQTGGYVGVGPGAGDLAGSTVSYTSLATSGFTFTLNTILSPTENLLQLTGPKYPGTVFFAVNEVIFNVGTYNFLGSLVGTGITTTAADFSFTPMNVSGYPSPTDGEYSARLFTTTPEPNSLVLLGTGLVSAAGMVFRKRRIAV